MPSRQITLKAPLSGVVVPLDQVPDPVFSQRLVGDGISIDPTSSQLLAPCDARVIQVHRARHALTLAADAIEIIVHIGLDTVALNGDGFTVHVAEGDDVRTGDPLITFDPDLVARRARSLLTQILISNASHGIALKAAEGKVRANTDVLLTLDVPYATDAHHAGSGSEIAVSATVRVTHENGLHARPAGLIAACARRFVADVRLVKEGREANARSVVSIMALEVSDGDTLTISARGDDAPAALAALVDVIGTQPAQEVAEPFNEDVLHGIAASPGAAVGNVFLLRHEHHNISEHAADAGHERHLLESAIATAHAQLDILQARLADEADRERAAIFAAHQELLADPEIVDLAIQRIHEGASAAYAWKLACELQADRLLALNNPLLSARAADMRDICRRVLHALSGKTDGDVVDVPAGSIIIAEDLTPSETVSFDRSRMRGLCTTMGSATSHVAILARALAIPAVTGIDPRALELPSGTRVLLDGDAGILKLSPTAADETAVAEKAVAVAERRAEQLIVAAEPAITRDGHRIEVGANIGDEAEADVIGDAGADGVGLLRTEFLFMGRHSAPDEAEQARVYEKVTRATSGRVIIRALDVGGDKPLPYLPMASEANPFLGERGIRLLLNRPEILRTQLRAVLRAANAGRVAVMFPMISTMSEWQQACAYVEEERRRVNAPPLQIGIMVETASAALLAQRFAETADFFSIGTNDLTQYTLAMDRTDPRAAAHLDALHPAVLKLIAATVQGARAHNRWVGLCGALGSDPQAIPVLLGLGIDELSVSLPAIPAIKARIRTLSLDDCRATAQAALSAADGSEVRNIVRERHGAEA